MSESFSPVRAEQQGLDLHLVEISLGEQRTDRTIRDAAGENFLLGRAAFALEETAGETPRGRGLFTVIDREREKVQAPPGLGRAAGCDQDDGISELDGDRAVRLFGYFAGFNMNLCTANVGGYFV